jgi:hypothetical protein
MENDGRVRAEHCGQGVQGVDGFGLFDCEALNEGCGVFVGAPGFVDLGGMDIEAQACLGEEIAAAG